MKYAKLYTVEYNVKVWVIGSDHNPGTELWGFTTLRWGIWCWRVRVISCELKALWDSRICELKPQSLSFPEFSRSNLAKSTNRSNLTMIKELQRSVVPLTESKLPLMPCSDSKSAHLSLAPSPSPTP